MSCWNLLVVQQNGREADSGHLSRLENMGEFLTIGKGTQSEQKCHFCSIMGMDGSWDLPLGKEGVICWTDKTPQLTRQLTNGCSPMVMGLGGIVTTTRSSWSSLHSPPVILWELPGRVASLRSRGRVWETTGKGIYTVFYCLRHWHIRIFIHTL